MMPEFIVLLMRSHVILERGGMLGIDEQTANATRFIRAATKRPVLVAGGTVTARESVVVIADCNAGMRTRQADTNR